LCSEGRDKQLGGKELRGHCVIPAGPSGLVWLSADPVFAILSRSIEVDKTRRLQ
jgi:hypothetical protein